MIKIITTVAIALSLGGCLSAGNKQTDTAEKATDLGERDIKYYSNKTVTSLDIPPDLTQPSAQNAFKLSEYVSDVKEDTISFSDKDNDLKKASNIPKIALNIEVKRAGERRWLVVEQEAEAVWDLSKSFLKSHGFELKKSNKEVGIMETDFLEKYPEIPDQSVGFVRSMLKKSIASQYTLPVVDKYRIRIESSDDGKKTAVYLSLTSMEEVLTRAGKDDENTIWQARPKDYTLETEMLYQLMTFLGSEAEAAKQEITTAKEADKITVTVVKGIGGYAKLAFSLPRLDTWDNVAWALDQLNIEVDDKDVKEGSFYVNITQTENTGIFSSLLNNQSFQIMVKQIDGNLTEVYFNDLSEKNEQATIDLSYKFLGDIAKQF